MVRSLGELDVPLYGMSAGVEPASPIVPKGTASGLRIVVKAGGRTLSSGELARLLGGPFEVQGELSGPGLSGVLSLPRTGAETIPSPDPLVLTFPGLPKAGEYDISNLRLVRGGHALLDVVPRRVTLRVIEQVLVTSVTTRPLTLDEIRERGVILDDSSYLGFEFAITLTLESTPVTFTLPVVFDREGVPIPVALQLPPEPLRSMISAPQFVPLLMRPRAPQGDPDGAPPPTNELQAMNVAGARIPSLLVIPGSVGYLKQFFSAQLVVGNGAPSGSGLVLREVTGTLRLPPGDDGRTNTADDPLALPSLEGGSQSPVIDVLGIRGATELQPGEFGSAELTLRGEREGRHNVDFDISAKLEGLPIGPVALEGQARGVVLVRNAYFDVTFAVPTVVRADEDFSVFATVTNIGQGVGNHIKLTVDASRLSGARLLSSATQTLDEVAPKDSQTLEYRFRSEVTGEVVASYLRFDTSGGANVTGRLNFTLGVGERHVAMSPDTLVLPAAVQALPTGVVRAAMRVLGNAWSAANATSLPPGVARPSTSAVFQKGLAVAEAGLRVQLGQPVPEALRDLLLDLHGGLFDPGFDQALRETAAGVECDRTIGLALESALPRGILSYEEDAAEIAASGPPFLSFALDSGSGPLAAQLSVVDGNGRRTSLGSREVPSALVVGLGEGPGAPQLGWVPSLSSAPYTIHVVGTASGFVGLSLTRAGDTISRVRIEGIPVQPGVHLRIVVAPGAGPLELERDGNGDGIYEQRQQLMTESITSRGPQLVSAATIGPETLAGANPFGTYAALLFDRVVSESAAADLDNYDIAENSVVAAKRQLSGRLVFAALRQPEGPLVPTRLLVRGIHDERGRGGAAQGESLQSRLILPGAVVSGQVLQADGTPIPNALVTYVNAQSLSGPGGPGISFESGIAAQRTDASGRYRFRYVSQNPAGLPFRIESTDPDTGALRGVKSYVRLNGQHLTLDLVLVGHGRVAGAVRHANGSPAAGARVRVVSVTDSQIGLVTTTDQDGTYAVEKMTVGSVAVTAVLGANLGRGAGRLDAAGGTTTVDVTLDGNVDLNGVVRKLESGVLTPVPGADVVYYRDNSPLGVSVTDSEGRYQLLGVPAGPYRLETAVNQRDRASVQGNSIAGQKLIQNLVIEIREDGASQATVRGSVRRPDGTVVADAWVSDGIVATRADSLGRYELIGVGLSQGTQPRRIEGVSPDGRRSGWTSVLVNAPGQVVNNVDIEVSGLGAAVFQVLDPAGAPVTGASVGLQGSCLHPCGCRFTNTDGEGLARFADLSFGPAPARAVVSGDVGRWDSALGTATVTSEDGAAGAVIQLAGFGSVTGVVFNPDGQPSHGALVELTALRFVSGSGVCGLQKETLAPVYTDARGAFRFENVHVGAVTVNASSTTFPRIVSGTGQLGVAGGVAHLELQLQDTMAGVLSGTVWLPNGTTVAGPDVEVTANGSVPAVTVRTNELGQYSFARVLPAGSYWLSARDARPEGTGSVAQEHVWLQASQAAQHDLRLKAKGPVHVTVVDGSGTPVDGAVVRVGLVETGYPGHRYEGTISNAASQPLVFPSVFEGDFSMDASDNFGRGGRASGAVPPDGQPVEVKVRLTTIGHVAGRFLWPDRVTPIPFGTVKLIAGARVIGQQTTTSGSESGSYSFDYVPAGPVRLEAEDPASGRTGVATGNVESEGQVLSLDVVAQAVGRVEGEVTLNGEIAPGAEVALRSGQYRVRVTTDGDGRYAVDGVPEGPVDARADLGGGFLAGTAKGTLAGEGTTLSLPVALHDAGSIDGHLLAAGGASGPGGVSLVTLTASGRNQTTTTDSEGDFHFDLVPEGQVQIAVEALGSIDCVRQSLAVTGGETAAVTLALKGVGAVQGTASSSAGPVGGALSVVGTGPGCVSNGWSLTVGPSGQYRIPELLAGDVSASFRTTTVGAPPLYAKAAGSVSPGVTTTLNLAVEPSGRVEGTVLHEDGTPAIGAKVRVEASAGRYTLAAAGIGGAFVANAVPAGPVTIRVSDAVHSGVALVTGLSVPENSSLPVGVIRLVEAPLDVTSVSPPTGAIDVPITQPIGIAFNSPLAGVQGFAVQAGGRMLGFTASLSTDGRTVTLVPRSEWPDSAELSVDAGIQVTDVYGRRLPSALRTAFRTVDLSPPRVLSIEPSNGAIEVNPSTAVTVRFDEPLSTGFDLQAAVRLTNGAGNVPGVVSSTAPDTLVLTPAAALPGNARFSVAVAGAVDMSGHVQIVPYVSSFATPDTLAPVLQLTSPPTGAWTRSPRPSVTVTVTDALVGPDTSHAEMHLDGETVQVSRSQGIFQYLPLSDLAEGTHTVEASAHDRAGNRGQLVATFSVDTRPPEGVAVTAPTNDQVLSGTVALSGSANDAGSGVSRLSFFRDGQWLTEATAAQAFSASWNTAGTADGAHLVAAQAVDAVGNSGLTSAPVRVIVNNHPLGVTITSPADGVTAATQVSVAAVPSEPVTRVEFRAGSGPTVVDETAPFEATLDVTTEPEGPITVSVTAVGLATETATATRTVVVDRTPPATPDPTKVQAQAVSGSVLVVGFAGAVEQDARVEVTNPTRQARNERSSFPDRSFALRVGGAAGETIGVVAIDKAGNRSDPLALTVSGSDPVDTVVPQQGLTLWARSGLGMVSDVSGRLSQWASAAQQANDLVQANLHAQPTVATDPASGMRVAHFDGADDLLALTTRLSGSIRTVFAVVREDADAGSLSRALLGDASTHDFYGSWAWWYSSPSYVSTSPAIILGQTWVNGRAIDGRTTARPQTLSVVCVQAMAGVTADRLGGGMYGQWWKGDVAELLVYDRALTNAERKAVEDYLALQYAAYVATAGAPAVSPNGGNFESSVTVTLDSPTPGARTHYTTDGSEPTEASPLYGGPFALTTTATVRARSFRTAMKPSAVVAVSFARSSDFSPRTVTGLAVWVRGDVGLEADAAGRVVTWRDQSGSANDLVQATPAAQPLLDPGVANNLPAVHFDGTDDSLSFTRRLSGSIRTVFAVVREDADAGSVSRALLGDASTHDFYGTWAWWYSSPTYVSTSDAIISGQTWINGAVIDGRTTARPRTLSVVCIQATAGVTADRLGSGMYGQWWKGDVAELLVYDRALTNAERKAVEDYLALQYAAYVATAGAPEFSPNGASFESSVTVTLSSPTPYAKTHYTTDGTAPTEASPLYGDPFILTSTTTVQARAFRAGMNPSPVSVATFTDTDDFSPRTVAGLAVWVRGDAGLEADAAGRVVAWRDQSGRGNDLVQPTPAAQPLVDLGVANNLPAVHFDGTNDSLPFTTRLSGSIRTVFAVVREDADAGSVSRALLGDASTYDFYGGAPTWWYTINGPYYQTSPLVALGQTWVNGAVVVGRTTARPTTLSVVCIETTGGVTADRLGSGGMFAHWWKGDVAELLVYDRPLTLSERKEVEDYLALQYAAYVATAGAPEFSPNGGAFLDSVTVALRSPTPSAAIHYTTNGSEPTEASPLYTDPFTLTSTTTVQARAFRARMNPSPVSVATFTDTDDFSPRSVAGLAVWVRGDVGLEADAAGRVVAWRDQSGRGNNLVQATPAAQPLADPGVANNLPAVHFDGTDDSLFFTTRLAGSIRTVFAVVREDADAGTGARSLLGDATAYDFYGGTPSWWFTINGSYYQTSPLVALGQTWVNGAVVVGQTTARPRTLSVVCIETTGGVTADRLGGGGTFPHRWKGHVAELLVYDRALTIAQRKSVEDYLAIQYAAYVATAGAPEFSPNGGAFETSVTVTLRSSTPGARTHYTTDGSQPTEASPLYTVPLTLTATTTMRARSFRPGWNASRVATASFARSSEPSPRTIADLALWVRGDAGLEVNSDGHVVAWRDQSGSGNDLVQATRAAQPLVDPVVANNLPAVHFDGTDDNLLFTARLSGSVCTVFAVVSEDADAGSGYRALLGDASTHDFYGGAPTWWYAGQTSASIIAGQTRVNGVAIDGKATPRPRILSVVTIQTLGGALTADRLGGGMSAQWWKGHVAELLVYNRVLSASERESVERRLALEYTPLGATVATPEFSPNGGSFEGSVSVSITTATPGATLRYTTNGAQPTEASASYAGPLVLTSSTLLQARAFRAGMEPSSVSAAAFVPGDDVWSPVGIPGLVLRVSSDVGVNADGANKVQSWLDLSGHSNHLGQTTLGSQPSFVPNVASGRGVVRFDGSDDALLFTTRLTSIRTVFWVVREEAAAPNAYHFLLGDGSTYAFHSGSARQIWGSNTDAAVLTGQTRVNGVLVDGTTTNRPTTLSVVSLVTASSVSADAFSRDRTYGRSWWGDLAELIVFDRALTNVERKAVEDGLALKYGLYVPTVGTPVITPNGSTSPVPVRVTIAAEEGAEVHITTDGSEPTVASAGYVEPFVLGAPTVVKARAFRADHQPSAVATARFLDGQTPPPLRASGLKMWVEADVGVTTVGGAVSSWADQSGNGNDLVQATASTRPLLVAGEANGHPVIRLDGVGDFLSFTSRLTTMRTIFWVIRRSPSATPGYRMLLGDTSVGGTYDFSSDGTTKIWSSNFTSANIRSGSTWLNGALINGTTTERPTSLSVLSVVTTGDVRAATISKDRGGDYSWWGDIAALIIYDRALTDTERQMIEGYLASKYAQYVPSVVAPTISPSDGRVTGAQLVQLDSATVGATVRYTLDDTEPTESSTPYAEPLEITGTTRIRARAFRQGWNASPETVVTFFDDADATPARLPGLALWVRADSGLGGPNAVSLWPDQSASANHLIQTGVGAQPSVLVDGTSRMPVVRLDGAGDYLSFTSRLTTIRTVFWVIRRSLLATPGYRMLLGDGVAGGTGSFYSDSTTKIWHLTASNALIRNGVTRLNATPVDGTTTDRPTDLSVISLVTTGNVSASTFSRYSSASDYSWWGDLAELIIYDYPLSDSDVRSIEEYLAGRYGIALAP